MIERYKDIARSLVVVLWLAMLGSAARAEQPSLIEHSKSTLATPSAASGETLCHKPEPFSRLLPPRHRSTPLNSTDVLSQEVGYDIHATIDGWKRGLDRLEGEFRRTNLRYVELNSFRDALQGARSEVTALWNALRPRLAAAKAEVDLLEPAPAAGQPQELQQAALRRAEINYHLGLLSEGQSAVNAANLRIDQLTNAVQDIRRKNFTTKLFQRVPGLYSYQTWADTPEYAPLVAGRVADLMVDWWKNVRDHDEVVHIAIAATLSLVCAEPRWLVGPAAAARLAWRGRAAFLEPCVLRGRHRHAANFVGRKPDRFFICHPCRDAGLARSRRLAFYVAAQSIIIVLTVVRCRHRVPAKSARWRLIPASDHAGARLCGLIILLAVVYGLSSLAYVATLQVQAPFALTMVIAFSSSLLTCAIVVAILLTPLGGERLDACRGFGGPKRFGAIRAAMAAIVVSALVGYLSLSRFLARQLIVTGSIRAPLSPSLVGRRVRAKLE